MQCGLQQSCQPLILLQTLSAYRSFAPSPASSLQTWSNAYSVALCDVLRCANGSNRSRIATGLHRGLLRAGLRQVLPLVRHVRRQVAQGLPQDVPFLVIKDEFQDGHASHGHTATRPYIHGHTATRPYSHGHTATRPYSHCKLSKTAQRRIMYVPILFIAVGDVVLFGHGLSGVASRHLAPRARNLPAYGRNQMNHNLPPCLYARWKHLIITTTGASREAFSALESHDCGWRRATRSPQ
jgi:hypothetical protein